MRAMWENVKWGRELSLLERGRCHEAARADGINAGDDGAVRVVAGRVLKPGHIGVYSHEFGGRFANYRGNGDPWAVV